MLQRNAEVMANPIEVPPQRRDTPEHGVGTNDIGMHEPLRILLQSQQRHVIRDTDLAGPRETFDQPAGLGLRQWCVGGHGLD